MYFRRFLHEGQSLLLLTIAFLFPLATYLLILGMINRRRSPMMVPGTWDFVGVLFGCSGFVLAGGWYLLRILADQLQGLGTSAAQAPQATARGPMLLWLLVGLYFVLLVLGVVHMLLQRRMYTSIYNVDPQVFECVLSHVLDAEGYSWSRTGNRLIIQTEAREPASTAILATLPTAKPVAIEPAGGTDIASLTLQPSKVGYSVGLRWECHSDLAEHSIRQELERALDRELSAIVTKDNHVALWLVSPSFLMLVMIFLCLVLQVIFELFR